MPHGVPAHGKLDVVIRGGETLLALYAGLLGSYREGSRNGLRDSEVEELYLLLKGDTHGKDPGYFRWMTRTQGIAAGDEVWRAKHILKCAEQPAFHVYGERALAGINKRWRDRPEVGRETRYRLERFRHRVHEEKMITCIQAEAVSVEELGSMLVRAHPERKSLAVEMLAKGRGMRWSDDRLWQAVKGQTKDLVEMGEGAVRMDTGATLVAAQILAGTNTPGLDHERFTPQDSRDMEKAWRRIEGTLQGAVELAHTTWTDGEPPMSPQGLVLLAVKLAEGEGPGRDAADTALWLHEVVPAGGPEVGKHAALELAELAKVIKDETSSTDGKFPREAVDRAMRKMGWRSREDPFVKIPAGAMEDSVEIGEGARAAVG